MSLDKKVYFYASVEGEYCKDEVSINDFNKDKKFRVITSPTFGADTALELRYKGYTLAYLFKNRQAQKDYLISIDKLK